MIASVAFSHNGSARYSGIDEYAVKSLYESLAYGVVLDESAVCGVHLTAFKILGIIYMSNEIVVDCPDLFVFVLAFKSKLFNKAVDLFFNSGFLFKGGVILEFDIKDRVTLDVVGVSVVA